MKEPEWARCEVGLLFDPVHPAPPPRRAGFLSFNLSNCVCSPTRQASNESRPLAVQALLFQLTQAMLDHIFALDHGATVYLVLAPKLALEKAADWHTQKPRLGTFQAETMALGTRNRPNLRWRKP